MGHILERISPFMGYDWLGGQSYPVGVTLPTPKISIFGPIDDLIGMFLIF
jgi:hypothetical protein